MSQYDLAFPLVDIPAGQVVGCSLRGIDLAVYNVNGEIYASQDECSHGKTSLSEGELDEYEIECPLHRGTFDVRTGMPGALPCTVPIKTYPVRIENGNVFIDVENPLG